VGYKGGNYEESCTEEEAREVSLCLRLCIHCLHRGDEQGMYWIYIVELELGFVGGRGHEGRIGLGMSCLLVLFLSLLSRSVQSCPQSLTQCAFHQERTQQIALSLNVPRVGHQLLLLTLHPRSTQSLSHKSFDRHITQLENTCNGFCNMLEPLGLNSFCLVSFDEAHDLTRPRKEPNDRKARSPYHNIEEILSCIMK
jgi:hypothetical protein